MDEKKNKHVSFNKMNTIKENEESNISQYKKKENRKENRKENKKINDMSFSVIMEKGQSDILGTTPPDNILSVYEKIYPKQMTKWMDSDVATQCNKCSQIFNFFVRKHHCRVCGYVYCGTCCKYSIKIPEELIKIPNEDFSLMKKLTEYIVKKSDESLVCDECYIKVKKLSDISILIKIFSYLNVESLLNILKVSQECKNMVLYDRYDNSIFQMNNWESAVIYQLSKFREIQYICQNDNCNYLNCQNNSSCNSNYAYSKNHYNQWQVRVMWDSRNSLIQHNCWMICFIKASIQYFYATKNKCIFNEIKRLLEDKHKKYDCINLMCSRKCKLKIDILDYIDIFKFLLIHENKKNIFFLDENIRIFMLYLAEYINMSNELERTLTSCIPIICNLLSDLMNKTLEHDVDIEKDYTKFVYEFMENFTTDTLLIHFQNEIHYLDSLQKKTYGQICLLPIIRKYIQQNLEEDIRNNIYIARQSFIKLEQTRDKNTLILPIVYPFDPSYNIVEIIGQTEKKTATRPLILSVVISKGAERKKVNIMLKKDNDLRQEQIVTCVIYLMQHKLFQQSEKKRIIYFEPVPTYRIYLISFGLGIIEFVPNSVTLGDLELPLQSYVMQENVNEYINDVTTRFSNSLAISSCLAYILGVGDRHKDNMMVTSRGQFFHIDFGYIMSNPTTNIFPVPNIKLTQEMIDFLGGKSGKHYKKFCEFFTNIYDIMRLYKNIVIHHYDAELMNSDDQVKWDQAKNMVETRFMEGISLKNIEITLIHEINKATSSYGGALTDTFHDLGKMANKYLFWK